MGQDLPYKWRNSLHPPKVVVKSVNYIPIRRNMFIKDNITIYINVKKQWENNKINEKW